MARVSQAALYPHDLSGESGNGRFYFTEASNEGSRRLHNHGEGPLLMTLLRHYAKLNWVKEYN